MNQFRVAELFAGVGGFRIGLEAANEELGQDRFKVVWSNQWEPSTKVQHASDVYVRAFGPDGHSNDDIATVAVDAIPDIDLLVGGFPCQDYSVATTLQRSGGLAGKKGVLWWQIHRILRDKTPRPKYILLENVDRLLKSPASQRGRDFAVMLASLADLGYAVEWRVVNAADYGMPQRRRRVFILGYLEGTPHHEALTAATAPIQWLAGEGVFAQAFPVTEPAIAIAPSFTIAGSLVDITNEFNAGGAATPFAESGCLIGRTVSTVRLTPAYEGPFQSLGEVLIPEDDVPDEFFLDGNVDEWGYLKGAKTLERTNRTTGHAYVYSEGGIAFPDPLDRPSRTIITGEGGTAPSRFKHVVTTPSGRLRRLVPIELERLNMFPDDHTAGPTDSRRAFLMGNALVTGIVHRTALGLVRLTKAQVDHATAKVNARRAHEMREQVVSLD